MALNIGALTATLGLDSKEFDQGLNDAEKRFKQTNEKLEKLSGGLTKVGASLVALSAPFLALAKSGLEGTKEMENFKAASSELAAVFAEDFKPILETVTKKITELTAWYRNLDGDTRKLIVSATLLTAGVGAATVAFGQLIGVIKGAREAMMVLNATKIASPQAFGIGILAAGVVGLISLLVEAENKRKRLFTLDTTEIRGYDNITANIAEYQRQIRNLTDSNAAAERGLRLSGGVNPGLEKEIAKRNADIAILTGKVQQLYATLGGGKASTQEYKDAMASTDDILKKYNVTVGGAVLTTQDLANTMSEYSQFRTFVDDLGQTNTALESFLEVQERVSDGSSIQSQRTTAAFQNLAIATKDAMTQAGQSFVDFLDRIGGIQELTLAKTKEFVKELAILMISSLEKQIIAEQVAQIARTWARNIGTFGVLGVPKAAGESALILGQTTAATVALEALKAGIRGLAEGGIATGPSLAVVGEGKYNEAVLPLSQKTFSQLANGIVNRIGAGQAQSIVNNNNVNRNINIQLDGKIVASYTEDYLLKQARNRGSSLYTPRGGN